MKKSKSFLHDHLFKEVFSQIKYLLDLLSLVLSKKEMNLFDWTTTKTEATSFIDKKSREQRMDLLVSALFKNSEKRGRILFLMEHKSQDDPELMRQFLSYQSGIYQQTQDPVIPVFINQSPRKEWKGPRDFHGFLDNFDGPLRACFKENVLNFRPRNLHLQALDVKKEAGGLTARPILYIMKHIWNLDESKVKELFTISEGLSEKDRKFLVDRAVDYIRQFDPTFGWKIVEEVDQSIKEKEGKIMPPLQYSLDEAKKEGWKLGQIDGIEKGRQEGRQEGMQQGMQQGQKELILKLLESGFDMQAICKGTGMSEEELKKLKNGS